MFEHVCVTEESCTCVRAFVCASECASECAHVCVCVCVCVCVKICTIGMILLLGVIGQTVLTVKQAHTHGSKNSFAYQKEQGDTKGPDISS